MFVMFYKKLFEEKNFANDLQRIPTILKKHRIALVSHLLPRDNPE